MALQAEGRLATIEAELHAPVASAQLVRFDLPGPVDDIFRDENAYYLDLCLTPRMRNARACYHERWSPQRFEQIGDLFAVPPGEALQARSDGGRQNSIICQLRAEALQRWTEGELEWTDRRLHAGLDINDANIRGLLLRLADEIRNPGFASAMLVELVAGQLAIELARYSLASGETAPNGGLSGWRLRRIEERFKEEREPPTLDELAQLCGLSVRQLTRGFRSSRGCSIGDYAANCRLEHGKRMLASEQSVKAIAYTLGFASPSSFCFAFRRATGETPQQYRERLRRITH